MCLFTYMISLQAVGNSVWSDRSFQWMKVTAEETETQNQGEIPRTEPSVRTIRRHQPAGTLILKCKTINFWSLSIPVYSVLLWQPKETNVTAQYMFSLQRWEGQGAKNEGVQRTIQKNWQEYSFHFVLTSLNCLKELHLSGPEQYHWILFLCKRGNSGKNCSYLQTEENRASSSVSVYRLILEGHWASNHTTNKSKALALPKASHHLQV